MLVSLAVSSLSSSDSNPGRDSLLAELPGHVLLQQFLKLLRDPIALQRDRLFPILVNRRHRPLAGARQADANVGVLALARSVDDAPHDCHGHVLDAVILAAP